MTTTTDDIVDAIAAFGLPGTLTQLPTTPLDEEEWARTLSHVDSARTSGLLQAAIDAGRVAVTARQREDVLELHTTAMAQALVLEALLLTTAEQLEARRIEFRVLKGSAVAHLDYGDPALRAFGDVDLLVRSDSFDAAAAHLGGIGHQRMFHPPRPGFDRRFGKSTTFRTSDGLEIDLHRTFVLGPFGLTVDLDRVWARVETFELGGRVIPALDAECRLLHAAYHAVLGAFPARALALRDVAEMLLFGTCDDREAIALSADWRADAVLARAVNLAWSRFRIADVTRLSSWAARHRAATDQTRHLSLYETNEASYAAQSLAAVSVLPRIRDKVAFVRQLSLPDEAFLVEHMGAAEQGRLSWLARGIRRRSGSGLRDR